MKKLAFLFIAMLAMSFVSCGGQTASKKNTNDSDSIAAIVESIDSVVVDSLVPDSAVVK